MAQTETKQTELGKAVGVLTEALKTDKELYEGYKANIAMAFYDEAKDANWEHDNLHEISNKAAARFLGIWTG